MTRSGALVAAARALTLVALWAATFSGTITSTGAVSGNLANASDALPQVPVAEDFMLHCAACHRLDGTGTAGMIPTLHGVGELLATPAGRAYLVRVPGVAQAPLTDARLARLLNWVLVEFSGAEPDPRYTALEVGKLRASPLRDPAAARENLPGATGPDAKPE